MGMMSIAQVRINNLSPVLMSQSNSVEDVLGFIKPKDEAWRCKATYKATKTRADLETLFQILSRNADNSSAAEVVFSRRERLAAAANLAYSVLFLDGSWLQPVWCSNDVVLLKGVGTFMSLQGTVHTVGELAFSWVVSDPRNAGMLDNEREEKCNKLKLIRKTAVLFALAAALVELSLGEPLDKLKTNDERSIDSVIGNLAASSRLLPQVLDASGFEYHEVVRRYLDCPLDVRDPSMDNDAFLSIFMNQIAQPLMTDYERFTGVW